MDVLETARPRAPAAGQQKTHATARQIPRTWSAYVLVYVRDDVYDTVRDADCRNLPDFSDLKIC